MASTFGDWCRGEFLNLTEERLSLRGQPATHKRQAYLLTEVDLVLDRYNAWLQMERPTVPLDEESRVQ